MNVFDIRENYELWAYVIVPVLIGCCAALVHGVRLMIDLYKTYRYAKRSK